MVIYGMTLQDQRDLLSGFSAEQLGEVLPAYQARRATLFALKGLEPRQIAKEEGVSTPKVRKALDRAVFYMDVVSANS